MGRNRIAALAVVLAIVVVAGAGGWIAGSTIESPADAAARTAPPPPSPILVPVEKRVLGANVVTRGTGRFGLPQKISVAPSTLKPGSGLISTLPLRNAQLAEGSVILTASGRPLFLFQGPVPAYRDLGPGATGEDVLQLEQALARLGVHPGAVDGVYDRQTADAVSRWYTNNRFEPFGPTPEQRLALATLERDAAEANKFVAAAGSTAASAALAIDAARAAAENAVKTAAADLAAKQANASRFSANGGEALAVELERAKWAHAEKAAAADYQIQLAERALIVLDPRQPDTARAAAEAKLELARAAARKVKLEGEMAVDALQREAKLAAEQVILAEAALRSAKIEGDRQVQAAVEALKVAQVEVRFTNERAERIAGELDAMRRRLGVQVPLDEIVFVPALPVRVEEVSVAVGAPASGHVLSVTDNQLSVDSALTLEAAPLVKPGMPVSIDEQALGVKASGVVANVAATPGTRGVDGYHVYFEVKVDPTAVKLDGVSVRLTIPVKSTQGAVTAVPTSAISLSADGTSRVQVKRNDALVYVPVTPGLTADGYVEVTPLEGKLEPGELVVVGFNMPSPSDANTSDAK